MKKKICEIIFIFLVFLSFFSCARRHTEIHLHDRHGLSYDLVKNYTEQHGAVTLVLLDYHHDIRPEIEEINSVNWVGKLVENDYVKKVIWLSGKKLLLPNRESRETWLERSLSNVYPSVADKLREAVMLVDWYDLQKLKLQEPFVITLDFDVFTKDPGDDPELFVDELSSWIQKQKPELFTMCLSAAYQPEPEKAWSWLCRFVDGFDYRAKWFLESGKFGEQFESRDEALAREKWRNKPAKFLGAEYSFYGGAYLWQNAPLECVTVLQKRNIAEGNEAAEYILHGWNDKRFMSMKEKFSFEKMNGLCRVAEDAMQQFFEGYRFYAPEQNSRRSEATYGIAVRFKNYEEDRGCLSLYEGISEADIEQAVQYCAMEALVDPRYSHIRPEEKDSLFTNISVFGEWEKMNTCFDFIPGIHSLILEDTDGEKTLLQTAIALEHGYSREDFLSRLSNKAGLGFEGWKNSGLKFYKSETVMYTNYEK